MQAGWASWCCASQENKASQDARAQEKFRARLSEREAAMRERVEEEYRQREAARAAEFERTYAELRAVEAKVRQKLQQLHQREASRRRQGRSLRSQAGQSDLRAACSRPARPAPPHQTAVMTPIFVKLREPIRWVCPGELKRISEGCRLRSARF